MPAFDVILGACILYATFLFTVAFGAERLAARGRARWLRGGAVYTLSLSIYCTAWTFYGAVGYAARSGLEFATIYLGPTLVLIGWWGLLRKLVRVGRAQRVTSVADLISSRFGKSNLLGGLVTALAVIATTPYIALQLQSVTLSFAVFAALDGDAPDLGAIGFWVAAGLAVFAVLFGTRRLDLNERHDGIVAAIATEAIVKLVAFIAVGAFVVFIVAGGPAQTFAAIDASPIAAWDMRPGRWVGLTFLAGAAFFCLPRMFQVLVVENSDERHLAIASWAFPLYLFAMSAFTVPIAAVGLARLPADSNPDLYVLTLPLAENQDALALLAFLGGFSSATSMVIVAAIALATMISNHVVMPIWLRSGPAGAFVSGDVRRVALSARRISIVGILALGYLYFRLSGGGEALASIGLISFAGIAQVLPAVIGGLFWRGATRAGAAAGLSLGLAIWVWTLFLPSFAGGLPETVMSEGPSGLGWLRPEALFGIAGIDPILHTLCWSLLFNTGALVILSLVTFPSPIERLQGAAMVNVFRTGPGARGWQPTQVEAEDLLVMTQRILGPAEAQAVFRAEAMRQGKLGYLPDPTQEFLERLERELAGSVGGATAHAMLGQMTGGGAVSVEELMRVADETAQIMEYSARLETQSRELARTAAQLREANEKLTRLSVQKDAFLSQISHELRTPMTSIRSFSEILRDGEMEDDDRARFAGVIHDEALRLTRLLDDLLDLSVLESGQVSLRMAEERLDAILDRAIQACDGGAPLRIERKGALDTVLVTDGDRLTQVFINLVMNCCKYARVPEPHLRISVRRDGDVAEIDFVDNGPGIPTAEQQMIFEKFSRGGDSRAAGGAGLGLAICREIMTRLGGSISYLPGQRGAAFRLRVPRASARARAAE